MGGSMLSKHGGIRLWTVVLFNMQDLLIRWIPRLMKMTLLGLVYLYEGTGKPSSYIPMNKSKLKAEFIESVVS